MQTRSTIRRLEGHVALVTGGASGLGRAIAHRLVGDGAKVVISDVQAALGKKAAAEEGFIFLEQDVADEAQWTKVVAQIEARCQRLTILVNNAGLFFSSAERSDPEKTLLSDWRRLFAVNVEGVFLGCRAAIPAMRRAGGGSIVNMASITSFLATPYATAYGASKAAVRQLTKSVAQHCAEQGLNIRCNSVHPGDVRTPQWEKLIADLARRRGMALDQVVEEARTSIPMGDFTSAEDVAAAVSFLVSDDARHITGSKLIVDGGFVHCDTYQLWSQSNIPSAAKSSVTP